MLVSWLRNTRFSSSFFPDPLPPSSDDGDAAFGEVDMLLLLLLLLVVVDLQFLLVLLLE